MSRSGAGDWEDDPPIKRIQLQDDNGKKWWYCCGCGKQATSGHLESKSHDDTMEHLNELEEHTAWLIREGKRQVARLDKMQAQYMARTILKKPKSKATWARVFGMKDRVLTIKEVHSMRQMVAKNKDATESEKETPWRRGK